MAIRIIHQVPSELPYAHLYLDDIEEITTILLEAAAPKFASLKQEAKISYTIVDTKMDSIHDLQTRGGNTTNFEIDFGGWGPSLRFYSILPPEVRLYSLDTELAWATYGRIKSVFDRRQLRIKNSIKSLPAWLKWSLWILFILSPEFFPHARHGLYFAIGYTAVAVPIGYEIFFRPSRVFFVRSHERKKMSSEARRQYVREIIILIIGGVIGGLIIELINYFLHK